jgi:phospholipase/carboxylesterase
MVHGRRGVPAVVGDAGSPTVGADALRALERRLDLPEVGYVYPIADTGSWYPGRYTDPPEVNEPQLSEALDAYDARLTDLEHEGWPPDRVALVGFSQGACLTLEYVARHPRRYAAVAALTGALIGEYEDGLTQPATGLDDTPLLITTKEHDAWVAPAHTRASAAILANAGARVDLRILPGSEHTVTEQEVDALRDLMRGQMSKG